MSEDLLSLSIDVERALEHRRGQTFKVTVVRKGLSVALFEGAVVVADTEKEERFLLTAAYQGEQFNEQCWFCVAYQIDPKLGEDSLDKLELSHLIESTGRATLTGNKFQLGAVSFRI